MAEGERDTGWGATIQIPAELWEEWQAIFFTGARGIHPLFSNEMIRRAYQDDRDQLALDDAALVERLQPMLAKIASAESIFDRQELIAGLDEELQTALVRLYFGLLEHFVVGSKDEPEVLH